MGHPPHDRLWIALAGYVLLHFLGASTLAPEILKGSVRGRGAPIPMTVQLERAPVLPAATPSAQVSRPVAAPEQRFRAGNSASARKCCSSLPRLPALADPTVYTVGELDSLPVPVTPLDLGLPERASTEAVRFELLIDEHGAVHSISIAGPAAGDRREEELRATLAATVFVPARKDGRAVKSRIVLGVE